MSDQPIDPRYNIDEDVKHKNEIERLSLVEKKKEKEDKSKHNDDNIIRIPIPYWFSNTFRPAIPFAYISSSCIPDGAREMDDDEDDEVR